MSKTDVPGIATVRATSEQTREAVLNAARLLPPDEESVMSDLTEDEDRLFLDGILGGKRHRAVLS